MRCRSPYARHICDSLFPAAMIKVYTLWILTQEDPRHYKTLWLVVANKFVNSIIILGYIISYHVYVLIHGWSTTKSQATCVTQPPTMHCIIADAPDVELAISTACRCWTLFDPLEFKRQRRERHQKGAAHSMSSTSIVEDVIAGWWLPIPKEI